MAIEQFIKGTMEKCFNKYYYNELIIGKLAHSEFKTGAKKGDEVDVIMPGTIDLFDYTGGELPDAEVPTTSTAKVRIDKGKAFHFEIDALKKKQIESAKDPNVQVSLAKDYSMDAVKQFAAGVDESYGALYARAGHVLNDNGNAIELDAEYAKEILAYMQAEFQRGDKKGHTNWIDGQMMCVLPPEYEFYLKQLKDFVYVESGHKKLEKGFIGRLSGWEIYISNNVACPGKDDIYYPLFGIKGKTLAGGVSDNLNTMSYIPDKSFNTCYKGYGLYGVGAPRADFLGAVKIKAPLKLSTRTQ